MSRRVIVGRVAFVLGRLSGHFGGDQLVQSFQVGQRDAIVGSEAQCQLVIVFGLAPLAFDVQQGAKIAINSHVLQTSRKAKQNRVIIPPIEFDCVCFLL